MNSCVLMAEIIKAPELRYTLDGQTPIAEMLVQFPGGRAEDPPETLKVVGWGNLAQQIQEQYHQGDRVVIEGRLHMNTVDRPEGFKEKRAELTVSRIHPLGAGTQSSAPVASSSRPDPLPAPKPAAAKPSKPPQPEPVVEGPEPFAPNYDDIPF
jgi:single-strand DNA-binding protein